MADMVRGRTLSAGSTAASKCMRDCTPRSSASLLRSSRPCARRPRRPAARRERSSAEFGFGAQAHVDIHSDDISLSHAAELGGA
eukprot:869324-Pleurochrysis_carterae.AAC.1